MADEVYSNIRDILGAVIGRKLIDITQHDEDQFKETGSFIQLHFDDGSYLRFPIGEDGFDHNVGEDSGTPTT